MFVSRHIGPAGLVRRSLAVCLMLGVAAGPVLAQSRLGATDGRGPLLPPPHIGGPAPALQPFQPGGPRPSIEAGDAEHKERAELTAARLLAVARKDLAEGHPEIAQRVLEQLVARYPESAVAGQARRELFALYSSDKRIGTARNGQGQAQVPSQPPGQPGQPAGQAGRTGQRPPPLAEVLAKAPAATAPPSGESGWRTSVVGFRRLQDELRNGVGDRVFFSAGSADLGSRARAVISAQADWLQRRPDVDVVIEGHADDAMIGGDNEALAAVRANAIRDRLVAEGVDFQRIRTVPFGARDPVAMCSDSDCAAQNRRAVVQVAVRRSQGGENNGALPAAGPGTVGVQR